MDPKSTVQYFDKILLLQEFEPNHLNYYKTPFPNIEISVKLSPTMDKFDKLKLASSSFTERLLTSSTQMSQMVRTKIQDLLTTPTPESHLVDDATLETLETPNWGLNLRICTMINTEEINGTEVVKAIKKKVLGKSVVSQGLGLDLLEACTTNCVRVSSFVASEKVLEDLVKVIEDRETDHGNRMKAMQLIRAWGEARELDYLPVFRQTYESLKTKSLPSETTGNLESYFEQQPLSPPQAYPVPPMGTQDGVPDSFVSYNFQSAEETKEFLVIARSSLEILSSILNTEGEPKPIKEELTVSMYEKCKDSLPVIQRIIQSTLDDEVMMFDALNLHDELQQITSKYEELATALESVLPHNSVAIEQHEGSDKESKSSKLGESHTTGDKGDSFKEEKTESTSVPITSRYEELATALESGLPQKSVTKEQEEGSDKEAKCSMLGDSHTTADKEHSFKEEKTESSSAPIN